MFFSDRLFVRKTFFLLPALDCFKNMEKEERGQRRESSGIWLCCLHAARSLAPSLSLSIYLQAWLFIAISRLFSSSSSIAADLTWRLSWGNDVRQTRRTNYNTICKSKITFLEKRHFIFEQRKKGRRSWRDSAAAAAAKFHIQIWEELKQHNIYCTSTLVYVKIGFFGFRNM